MHHDPAAPKSAYKAVSPSSLADYIRTVYKLSSEATRQSEQRATLLSQVPELAPVLDRAERDPMDADARSRVVAEYMSRKLYWGAYALLSEAVITNRDNPEINLDLAVIWDAWGQYDMALQHGENAIANGADSALAFETIGRIHLHRNEPAEAITWYSRSLEQVRPATVLANIGYAHMLRSEWDAARTNLEEAVRLDNTLLEAKNNLAIVLSKTGDDKGALALFLQTARPAAAFNNMGTLYLEKNQIRDAQSAFSEALRLEPNYAMARRNMDEIEALMPLPTIIQLPAFEGAPTEKVEPDKQTPLPTPANLDLVEEIRTAGATAPEALPEPTPVKNGRYVTQTRASVSERETVVDPRSELEADSGRLQEPERVTHTVRDRRLFAGLAGLVFVTGLFAFRSRRSVTGSNRKPNQ